MMTCQSMSQTPKQPASKSQQDAYVLSRCHALCLSKESGTNEKRWL